MITITINDIICYYAIMLLCYYYAITVEVNYQCLYYTIIDEGVEIGVRDADFSDWTLKHWKGKKLSLVDPWLRQDSKVYNDFSNVQQDEQV
jgi:hypothetical protein